MTDCKECIIDKNYDRVTFTNKHNKDCKQYSDYDDKLEIQREYAKTLDEFDKCIKIHSSPRPIDSRCVLCGRQYWMLDGHICDKLKTFPLEII